MTAGQVLLPASDSRWLLCAAILAGLAVWVAWPGDCGGLRLRDLLHPLSLTTDRSPVLGRLSGSAVTDLAVLGGGTAVALQTGYAVLVLLCLGMVAALRRGRHRAARRREADLRRAEVRRFCIALSAELRAGRPPPDAAQRAAVPVPGKPPVLDLPGIRQAVTSALDLAGLLRSAARQPGAEALRRVATCWVVAEHRGAGLADAIDRLVDGLLHEESQRQEVAAQLAGARATARLLAVLPAFGLLLGAGIGADPVHVLLGTPYGLGCLLLGGALNVSGLMWTERLARAAEDTS